MTAPPGAPPNLRLIGGESLVWSDESVYGAAPPAAGRPLEMLAGEAGRDCGRILVAGPHRAELVGCLAALPASLTCLIRSYVDAVAMATRFPGARMLCGSLAKLGPDEEFDVVVALDGLSRLTTADGPDLCWDESLSTLLAALRPGGRLVLAGENTLGIHRLVAFAGGRGPDAAVAGRPTARPWSLVQLERRLSAAGLDVRVSYLGYAQPAAPSVLIRADVTAVVDAALGGYLDATLSAATGEAFAGRPVLSDPRRLVTAALRSGLAAELAPVWLVVADRPGAGSGPDLPEVIVADAGADAAQRRGWSVAYGIVPEDGGWVRRLVGAKDPRVRAAWPVRRDPARLAGPLPVGICLEEMLLDACLRGDLPVLRGLLTDFAGWLAGQCDGADLLPGEYGFVTPANTVHADPPAGFAVLDRSWSLAEPVPCDVAVLRGLRQFAVTLVTGHHPHPWPSALDADELTLLLAAIAGRPADRAVLRRAVELEVEITAAIRGLDERRRAELAQRLAAVSGGTPAVHVDGHRELHESVRWLRTELVHAESRLAWYDELLTTRERALARAQRRVTLLTGSLTFRIGRLLVTSVRAARLELTRLLRAVQRGVIRG